MENSYLYYCTDKAWIKTELCFEWLCIVDDHIGRAQNMRITLLVDNAKLHGKIGTLPILPHIDVIHLPANTTFRVQPLHSGVIANLRKRHRKQQLNKAIDLLEIGVTRKYYKTNIFLALEAMYEICNGLEPTVIQNCRAKTLLLATSSENKNPATIHEQVSPNDISNIAISLSH